MRMGEKTSMGIDVVSTGALSLDMALGVGGVPRGASSRSTAPSPPARPPSAMHIVAEAQKLGGICAYIDMPSTPSTPVYAK
jgi:recombination protein RecA